MNRIVIIGNGFDLAHGLPSRYEDFVLYLINEGISTFNENTAFKKYSSLFELIKNPSGTIEIIPYSNLEQIRTDINVGKTPNFPMSGQKHVINKNLPSTAKFSIRFNSKFFHDLFTSLNWTDIEKIYFNHLLEIFNHHKDGVIGSSDLSKLNSDFELMKSLLIEYITRLDSSSVEINQQLKYQFDKCLEDDDLYNSSFNRSRRKQVEQRFSHKNLERIIFVNFNYTSLLNQYVGNQNPEKYVIPIHGEVQHRNSIVFGYGDEMTEFYKKLEDLDSMEVLKHFKSHSYHFNDSYSKLLYEIENFEFDVVVYGHSLGMSDRVLLNTIFENENCRAIHLYHSGSANHFKKRIALSRHFNDKKAFRKKLIEETNYLKIER